MSDESNDPMNYLKQLNKPTIIAIGIVSLVLILALFPSPSKAYTLKFEMIVVENNTEYNLSYRISINDERQDYGDEASLLGDNLGCDPGDLCGSYTFENDFTYEGGFSVDFTLYAFGNEGDEPPQGCIEILVDFYSLGIDCNWYSSPDDGLNLQKLFLTFYVNDQVIDNV